MGHATDYSKPVNTSQGKHFSLKKTATISLAVATALTAVALGAASILNRPSAPAVETSNTPASNIETIITKTPASTKEDKAVLQLGSGATSLKYQKGGTSWEISIGERSLINGDFIDEKERYVIAWGKPILEEFYTKISFRDVKTGFETSNYVLKQTRTNKVLFLYDVPTGNGVMDFAILLGDTNKTYATGIAMKATKQVVTHVPVMEIIQLKENGPESYKSDLFIVPDSGAVINGSAARNKGGDYTITLNLETRSDPKGIEYTINTNDFPNLKGGTPIFQLR